MLSKSEVLRFAIICIKTSVYQDHVLVVLENGNKQLLDGPCHPGELLL